LNVAHDGRSRAPDILLGVVSSERCGVGDTGGDVAVEWIVRARLVGDDVDVNAAPNELREHVGGVRHQSDRPGRAVATVAFDAGERIVRRWRDLVEKALRLASLGARWLDLDHEYEALVQLDRP